MSKVQEAHKKDIHRLRATFFDNKSAMWTAIFTAILTLFTYMTIRLNERANDAAVATDRAFLNAEPPVTGTGIITAPETKQLAGFRFSVGRTNSGTTPTKSAISHINFKAWPSEIPDDFDFRDFNPGQDRFVVVGPKARIETPFNVPIVNIRQAYDRQSHLSFWGWIAYRDIFPATPVRLTEFCFEIENIESTKDIADASSSTTWGVASCKAHNCYDEGCLDYRDQAEKTGQALWTPE
jgi:hypothetical protein